MIIFNDSSSPGQAAFGDVLIIGSEVNGMSVFTIGQFLIAVIWSLILGALAGRFYTMSM